MAKESAWVQSFKEAGIATAACVVVGSALTNPQSNWYQGLRKPWFQPPGLAFPVVWTLLYGTTALGAAGTMATLRDQGRDSEADSFRTAHRINLALNAGWSGAFFRSHHLGFATVWAAILAASSADLAKRARAVSPTDGAPFVAYAAWCSFATVLSGSVAGLNRKA